MAQYRPIDLESLLKPTYTPPAHDASMPADHLENTLEWHQIVAITSLLQHYFQPDDQHPSGMLVADDVGVGKTLENYGLIASVVDILDCAAAGKPLPPIISESLALIAPWRHDQYFTRHTSFLRWP
jgi:hypothetical protein